MLLLPPPIVPLAAATDTAVGVIGEPDLALGTREEVTIFGLTGGLMTVRGTPDTVRVVVTLFGWGTCWV